jgi:Alanine-zipper, major outer membrane lipoprotein
MITSEQAQLNMMGNTLTRLKSDIENLMAYVMTLDERSAKCEEKAALALNAANNAMAAAERAQEGVDILNAKKEKKSKND